MEKTKMTGTISRRNILMGGAAFLGAGLLRGIPGTPLTPSINFMNSAFADLPRPDYVIRASSNENPYGPSQTALRAIADALPDANKYMDVSSDLIKLMSELEDVPTESIAVGSGSGEILSVGGLMASLEPGSVVCPDPTFGGLISYAAAMGTELIRVPVDANLDTDLAAMKRAIRPDTKMVYLCNPNNPIPNLIDKTALRDFVLEVSRDRLVFVDEAYHEFVDDPAYESLMYLVREGHKNIIISRTASKIHGLAALRIGFAFAHPDHIADINSKMTGQLNIVGMRAAYASYQDKEFQRYTLQQNRKALQIVDAMCDELGLRYVKSHANFTFFHTGHDIADVSAAMRDAGILIGRPFPPFRDWARISMAKPEEMEYFVQVYKRLYG
jgi:histidinol-phosphate aminotransferase